VTPMNPTAWTAEDYERAAHEFRATLPLDHFMEGIPQATQREIALASLGLLKARRPDVQVYNELLVQYFHEGQLHRVVPDNMVQISPTPCSTRGSFNPELEDVSVFWVLEWVTRSSEGKDYGDSFRKYEDELQVPYCLSFNPETEPPDFRLYRHNGTGYIAVPPNAAGRFLVPELELEVGLLEGWVRFWHRGQLLELPGKLEEQMNEFRREAEEATRQAEEARKKAERERQAKERAQQRANKEKERASKEKERADKEKERADREQNDKDEALRRAATAEEELTRLREMLARLQPKTDP
jgi:Uma2 family endonuclease